MRNHFHQHKGREYDESVEKKVADYCWNIDTLLDNAFWRGLYPNSMIKIDDCIYVGMRGGVYGYDLNTETEMWYDFENVG